MDYIFLYAINIHFGFQGAREVILQMCKDVFLTIQWGEAQGFSFYKMSLANDGRCWDFYVCNLPTSASLIVFLLMPIN